MKTLVSKIWKFLQSRNLALVLLAVVLVAVTLAWALHSNWVLSSWSFLTAVALLLLNTLACSITRISNLLNKANREDERLDIAQVARLKNRAELQTQRPLTEVISAVTATLHRCGYRVATRSGVESHLFGEKGKLGEWGSIVFHLSFLVILLGILYSGVTRYVGSIVITEGQTVTEQHQEGFQIRLDKFQATYHEGRTGTDYVAHLTVLDEGYVVKKEQVRVNQPLTYQGTTFLLERYGFSPRFVLRDAAGEELFNSFVNLRMLPLDSEDSFTIPETEFVVWVKFYPDMIMDEGKMTTDSLLPNNPVMSLIVSSDEKTLFTGPLALDDSAKFENVSLSFVDLRYWTQYRVVKDAGQALIFSGFWLSVTGLVVRYFFTQKRLWATIESQDGTTQIVLGGSASQFNSLYGEEFAKIVERMKKEIQHGPE
ncbi:cytochrome c biogenesis protein ResB [Chloroflexota bacterium]